MAPHAAIAAETPQIETAEASMTENSSSTRSRLDIRKQRYQTTRTTARAWTTPSRPARRISPKRTLVPRMTSPVLM